MSAVDLDLGESGYSNIHDAADLLDCGTDEHECFDDSKYWPLSLSLGVDFLRSIPYHYEMLKMVQYNFALVYTSRIGVVNGVSEAIATAFRPRRLFNRSFFG